MKRLSHDLRVPADARGLPFEQLACAIGDSVAMNSSGGHCPDMATTNILPDVPLVPMDGKETRF